MKRYAIGALVGAALGASTVYLTNAHGGSVLAYVQQFDKLRNLGNHVVVKGDCASSCTMMLGYPNMCLDPQAVLRFHPAYFSWGLFYVLDGPGTQMMLAHYPPDARKVIDRHGDLTKDPGRGPGTWYAYPRLFSIPATEFPEHLCG
jgi:hypothetical protein